MQVVQVWMFLWKAFWKGTIFSCVSSLFFTASIAYIFAIWALFWSLFMMLTSQTIPVITESWWLERPLRSLSSTTNPPSPCPLTTALSAKFPWFLETSRGNNSTTSLLRRPSTWTPDNSWTGAEVELGLGLLSSAGCCVSSSPSVVGGLTDHCWHSLWKLLSSGSCTAPSCTSAGNP